MLPRIRAPNPRGRTWLQSCILATVIALSLVLAPVEAPVRVAGVPLVGAEAELRVLRHSCL